MIDTPEQKRAIQTLGVNLCVDAGAGSGKTRVLVERIIHLLENEVPLEQIVAITFTEKAAAEMKERLRAACHDKAPANDSTKMTFWRSLERRIDTARISTIHSFCAGLLRENALALGLDPDFTVLVEAEMALFRDETVTNTLHSLLDAGDAAAKRAAVEYGVPRCIRMFKTMLGKSNLLARVGEQHPLLEPDALPGHWRNLVEKEHERRLLALQASGRTKGIRRALEAYAGRCSKPEDGREVMRLEMIAVCKGIEASKDAATIQKYLDHASGLSPRSPRKINWDSERTYKELADLQNSFRDLARDLCLEPFDEETEARAALITCDVFATYEQISQAYSAAKSARTCLDFDDLISQALKMLRENEALRTHTARGIRHLLIDEFQDTNAVQLEIALKLMKANGGPGAERFIVGDAKQSIYDFLGAEVEVFRQARDASDETILLNRNFRSVPALLNFVNDFFGEARILEGGQIPFEPLEAHRPSSGEACIEFLVPPEIEPAAKADDYRRQEGHLIASRIVEICEGAKAVQIFDKETNETRQARFGDVALLFRSTTAMRFYEDALQKRNIPFDVVAGAGFYERQEVSDFRNLLTGIVDPWNEMALLGFLRSPMAGLSDEAILMLCRQGNGLIQAFRASDSLDDKEQNRRLTAARELMQDLGARMQMPLTNFLRYALARTGYEAVLFTQHHGVQKASNLRKVVALASEFAHAGLGNLRGFVRYLETVAAQSLREGDAPLHAGGGGAVTLMTIHKAKGLEFPIVVLPDTSRGLRASGGAESPVYIHRRLGLAAKIMGPKGELISPAAANAIRNAEKEQAEAESARILYVALTRARDWLFIAGSPPTRNSKGSWFSHFDEHYSLRQCQDGDKVRGNGWSATIRRTPGDAQAAPSSIGASQPLSRDVLLAKAGPVQPVLSERRSISITALLDLMHKESDPEEPREGQAARAGFDARLRGTLAHRLLEVWDFAGNGEPPIERVLRGGCPGLQERDELDSYLHSVAERFRRSDFCRRLAEGAPIQKEVPFMLGVDGAYVSGIVDAVLADGTLVDYKTGHHRPGLHDRYEDQLRLYAAAYRTLLDKEAPAAFLYYIDTGEAHTIDVSTERVTESLGHATEAIMRLRSQETSN